jgi:hypothetical protein
MFIYFARIDILSTSQKELWSLFPLRPAIRLRSLPRNIHAIRTLYNNTIPLARLGHWSSEESGSESLHSWNEVATVSPTSPMCIVKMVPVTYFIFWQPQLHKPRKSLSRVCYHGCDGRTVVVQVILPSQICCV